ncbi:MAG: cardiolipin synthase [Rhodothermales bacterium]
MPFFDLPPWLVTFGVPALQVLGVLSALDAVMRARTPQGSTAWAVALIAMPLLALPAYWIFGRARFEDYVEALRGFNTVVSERLKAVRSGPLAEFLVDPDGDPEEERGELHAFDELATLPLTCGNDGRLLVDGHATFDAIFAAFDRAEHYILAQFYIIHDDEIGGRFKEKLIAAARRGVRVYLIYDEVGSHKLPKAYKRELEAAGVEVSSFSGHRSRFKRFRLNFRNHRKIVVVDGTWAAMGGLNVGDEYLGRDEKLSPWRDTHVAIEGPVVQGVQLSFVRDWYYGCEEIPEVRWQPTRADADREALVLASGPADDLETCGLLFTHAIESAEERVWIATPYFVPDGRVLGALQLAALRGVDVRILMPRQSDSVFFKYVPYAYLPDVERAGVKVYLHEPGFMHQKVLLVDEDYAAVSTANFDNRSFRLNFEITVLFADAGFARDVAAMLEDDFARSTQITRADMEDKSYAFQVATQVTRLFAPVL